MNEMKYYVLKITSAEDGKTTKSVYEFDTLTKALARFHKDLGIIMDGNDISEALIMVVNSMGGVHANEKYVAEVNAEVVVEE